MFCPRCATPNVDGAKFCRSCGTNLESVAVALTSESTPIRKQERGVSKAGKNWIDKRSEAMKHLIKGGGLLASSALLGVLLGLFSHEPDWIIIWLVLVGWMACFGVISVASGIGDMIESRFLRKQLENPTNDGEEMQMSSSDRRVVFSDAVTSPNLALPPSVTENTTNLLPKPDETGNEWQ